MAGEGAGAVSGSTWGMSKRKNKYVCLSGRESGGRRDSDLSKENNVKYPGIT